MLNEKNQKFLNSSPKNTRLRQPEGTQPVFERKVQILLKAAESRRVNPQLAYEAEEKMLNRSPVSEWS